MSSISASDDPGGLETGKLRLHLGCGQRFIPGFVHVDALEAPHVDHVGSVAAMPFIPDGAAELVYASHLLEHFGRHEYLDVLREWRRVLAPGGVLRLAVPDFAACARMYCEGRLERGLNDIVGLISGGQRDEYDFHKMIFDFDLLSDSLHEVGFTDVRRWDWRTVSHGDVDDYSQAYLPHMDKQTGVLMSLNVEATRAA
jgi:predicted SAM-dependent methyltransferase